MKYDLDYQGATEIFESRVITSIPPITGRLLENSYLPEFNQDILEEAERLNAVLPLIKWEVDNNDLSEAMSDELYLYYEDLLKGRLDGILDEEEDGLIYQKAVRVGADHTACCLAYALIGADRLTNYNVIFNNSSKAEFI